MHLSQQLCATDVRQMISRVLASHGSGQELHRLDAVLLVAAGRSSQEVAQWFGVDQRTVQRWVHNAATQSPPGPGQQRNCGRPLLLNKEALQLIIRDLQQQPLLFGYAQHRWSGKRLALHVQRRCGIVISVRSCQRLIAQHGPDPQRLRR